MKTGVDKIVQMRGGDPEKNKTGVDRIIELLGGDPPAKNQTGVDKIVEILENGGGGGNPNREVYYNGTPFQILAQMSLEDMAELVVALGNKEATAYLNIDATSIGMGSIDLVSKGGYGNLETYADVDFIALRISNTPYSALEVILDKDITPGYDDRFIAYAWLGEDVDDVAEILSALTVTLTIIWHPLPTP